MFSFNKRVTHILIFIAIIFCLIISKLVYIQIIDRDFYLDKANDLWQRDFKVSGSRGNILDSKGNYLANNIYLSSVIVAPKEIKDKQMCADVLSQILEMDKEALLELLDKNVSTQKILPNGKLIDDQKAAQIKKADLDGVYLVQDLKRNYPNNAYLAQVLGFTGSDNQGLAGLENYYDDILTAQMGSIKIPFDAKGHPLQVYEEEYIAPGMGVDVMLTIDSNIQDVMERELNNAMQVYDCDNAWGIAMNPNTGEVLAMVSKPDFDPNHYQEYPQEVINRNLPIWKSYEPGSTFKTVTFAAGLQEDLFDMEKDTYMDNGYEIVANARLKSWKAGGHGLQTYMECLQNSSNPCFVDIAQKLGKDKMIEYLDKFNFGTKTNIDMPGESSGILFNEENFNELEVATTGFGQGISATAIQLTSAFCAIVNGGNYYQPYITKAMLHPVTHDVLFAVQPNLIERVIDEDVSFKMRYALENVVAKGGAKGSYISGYKIGGKTGTAQKAVDGQYLSNEYILSYICAAPIDDPQIVIYMALDAPKSNIQYGGTVVAPIVKKVLEDVLVYLDVDKVDSQVEKVKLWDDPIQIKVENYIGKNVKEVKSSELNFVFVGQGEEVIDQLPSANTIVEENGTVWIYLGN